MSPSVAPESCPQCARVHDIPSHRKQEIYCKVRACTKPYKDTALLGTLNNADAVTFALNHINTCFN